MLYKYYEVIKSVKKNYESSTLETVIFCKRKQTTSE